jgi:hypothetical protein
LNDARACHISRLYVIIFLVDIATIRPSQIALDRMLATAAWEVAYGGGDTRVWQRIIDEMLSQGATLKGKSVSPR